MNQRDHYRISLFALLFSGLWIVIIGAALYSPLVVDLFWPRTSITLFVPPLVIDQKLLQQFEHETGIAVHVAYYENSTALLNKMASTKGRGYDLVFSDDHSLELLIKSGLVGSIDKNQLPFFSQIDHVMYHNYYDPTLQFTIPYFSLLYGIAYNEPALQALGIAAPISWSFLFQPPPQLRQRIAMTDDPREALLLATYYQHHSILALQDRAVQKEVVDLLRTQKEFVDAYSLERADHLMQTENCLASVMVSSDFWRVHRKSPAIAFTVPQEGAFVGFYSFACVKDSHKQELSYQLIRYLFKPQVMRAQAVKFGFMPSISAVMQGIQAPPSIHDYKDRPMLFFRNVISDSAFNRLWIQVLS